MERKEFIKILGVGALGMGTAPLAVGCLDNKNSNEEICRMTWDKLCGNMSEVYKNDAFKYIHPAKRIPNVLLYGDSISIAYTPAARESLEGQATVFRLFKNGGSSHNFIPNMIKMNETMFQPDLEGGWNFKWDLIHFNIGLHDNKYLDGNKLSKENGKQVSSTGVYKENLDEICMYLKTKYPKAKLIFATTTPVPANAKGRYEGDSLKFNKAAMEVLAKYPDIAINDLYAFSFSHLEEGAQRPGNVHYTKLGSTELGKRVAQIVAENL